MRKMPFLLLILLPVSCRRQARTCLTQFNSSMCERRTCSRILNLPTHILTWTHLWWKDISDKRTKFVANKLPFNERKTTRRQAITYWEQKPRRIDGLASERADRRHIAAISNKTYAFSIRLRRAMWTRVPLRTDTPNTGHTWTFRIYLICRNRGPSFKCFPRLFFPSHLHIFRTCSQSHLRLTVCAVRILDVRCVLGLRCVRCWIHALHMQNSSFSEEYDFSVSYFIFIAY